MPPARSAGPGPSRHHHSTVSGSGSARRTAAVRQHVANVHNVETHNVVNNVHVNSLNVQDITRDDHDNVHSGGADDNNNDDSDLIELFTDPMLGTPLSIYVEKDVENRDEVVALIGVSLLFL
jgi:glycerate-2-kinase